jgi:thiosulfate dehydrogenase [quinone] large subunit
MVHAVIRHGYEKLVKEASSEKLSVLAMGEGTWPSKVANSLLPPSVLLLRLVMGWVFVWAGFDKLIRGFDASGFLLNAKGPLAGWFQNLGENDAALDVIHPLVIWSQILIGIALIFGLAVRWAAFWGAVQMFMFYIAQFPPEHNPFMEYYLVYILALALLGALGAGRLFGLDAYIERLAIVRKMPGATLLLG